MVLIAAAVTTKTGKTIMSRQFVEMTKARIEGLLAAFPKLMSTGKQHTFVETESVRYVYQPLEKLYMLLITTKASNILEDLETLRLFSRVIPEYCRSMEEAEIVENAFNLIFAFDEIVALGYRESVNLAQIRTFVEMDSHEEKVYQAVRKTQEREAKNKMREKAKELQRQKLESVKKGGKGSSLISPTGFGSQSGYTPMPSVGDTAHIQEIKQTPSSYTPSKPSSLGGKSLKLGSKGRDVESFVDQLKNEGEIVQSPANNFSSAPSKQTPIIPTNPDCVQLRQEESLTVTVGRDGALKNFELHGIILLRIEDEKLGRVRFQVDNRDQRGVQLQTHPNIDKELFKSRGIVGLKNAAKPFPFNVDVGVLKWRFQTQDESALPLSINCWPSENAEGGCDVNIEYELEHQQLVLTGVVIIIPLSPGTNPQVADCDGEYHYDPRKNQLQWSIPLIDSTNKSGGLEFAAPSSKPSDFFPMNVSFTTTTMYTDLKASDVVYVEDGSPAKFTLDTTFHTTKFEIV